jgi:hypothetical protein
MHAHLLPFHLRPGVRIEPRLRHSR